MERPTKNTQKRTPMIKKLLLSFAAVAALALAASCSDDDDDSGAPDPGVIDTTTMLEVSETDIHFSKNGGETTFTITTNASPIEVTANVPWLRTTVSLGKDITTVTVIAQKFDGEGDDVYDPREGTLTVTAGKATKEVKVTQRPKDLLEPSDFVRDNFVLLAREIEYAGTGNTENPFKFKTNGEYTIEYPWWVINTGKEPGEEKYEVIEKFCFLGNYSDQPRVDSIVFTLGDQRFACHLVQAKTEFDFSAVKRTAHEVMAEIDLGWNATDAHLDGVREIYEGGATAGLVAQGVNAVRIPCSFLNENGNVNEFWLSNIKKSVDAVVKGGSYAIVSLADDGWLTNHVGDADTTALFRKFTIVWNAVATELIGFDDHVLFEAYDRYDPVGTKGPQKVYERLNELFVQTVRRTGANNFKRCLVLPIIDVESNSRLTMPQNDETPGRLIASFPFFAPRDFAVDGTKIYWGEPYKEFTDKCAAGWPEAQIRQLMSDLLAAYTAFPLMINACGTIAHASADEMCVNSEADYANAVARAAYENQVKLFLWDDGTVADGKFGIFNVASTGVTVGRQSYLDAFIAGLKGEMIEKEEPAEEETQK